MKSKHVLLFLQPMELLFVIDKITATNAVRIPIMWTVFLEDADVELIEDLLGKLLLQANVFAVKMKLL